MDHSLFDRIKSRFHIKWIPLKANVPVDGYVLSKQDEDFLKGLDNVVVDGGYALISGQPGVGKSALLRTAKKRFEEIHDLKICQITRPQGTILDIYRELGDALDFEISAFNRYGAFKKARAGLQKHISQVGTRALIIIDEAQLMRPACLDEIRILSSDRLDSKQLISILLAGDGRLNELLLHESLLPLKSRIALTRTLKPKTPTELISLCERSCELAGNPSLIDEDVVEAICNSSAGSIRALSHSIERLLIHAESRGDIRVTSETMFHCEGGRE